MLTEFNSNTLQLFRKIGKELQWNPESNFVTVFKTSINQEIVDLLLFK